MVQYIDEHSMVDQVIEKVGNNIVLATPLAIGKPNHIINAFYKKAKSDPNIQLTILTALTLQKPTGNSDLEKRFIGLFSDRVFKDYPDLDYELDRTAQHLPENVKIIEFYFAPGKYMHNKEAQRHYISTNYTHVVRDVMDRGVNVVAQMVSEKNIDGKKYYSLSSNPDTSLDLIKALEESGKPLIKLGQVNAKMPFMYGDSVVEEDLFDFVLDDPQKYFQLFGPPKMSVSEADYMIGLYCSSLVQDDGEIQIGIGSLGDATIYSLILRQNNNELYKRILNDLQINIKFQESTERCGNHEVFNKGLFGASEMIVDGFMHLYLNGIVKKKVYDNVELQRLLNAGLIKEKFSYDILQVLWKHNVIHKRITKEDFDFLQKWGIFREGLEFKDGHIYIDEYQCINPIVNEPENKEFFNLQCLGTELKNGQVMQGGFFLGPGSFYKWLRELPDEERKLINMKSVQKINQLYGHETLDRLHRKNARFINTCMMQTLAGAAVSDGLEDGRVVSGVGGQYNFVAMAQELPDGHSILNLRSTRMENGKLISNIVPHYGNITIPRHLRDIVVTEYGIAFIRGKTDEEIIKALLNICDSRFQKELMQWAKKKGKLDDNYRIPEIYTNNYPESYHEVLATYEESGLFPVFPFGTDLTEEEIKLGKALKLLKADLEKKPAFVKTLLKSLFKKPGKEDLNLLAKMSLDHPKTIAEKVYSKLIALKLEV